MGFEFKDEIERRENTGEKVTDADKYIPEALPACINDTDADPTIPIEDKRIENFLAAIVDSDVHTTEEYYKLYKQEVTPITGVRRIDMNNMRTLMMKKRIRERLKFLRASEWELNRPTITDIARRLKYIADGEETKPSDAINALNSLVKLANLAETPERTTMGKINVVFNMQERPKENVKDVIINADAHEDN